MQKQITNLKIQYLDIFPPNEAGSTFTVGEKGVKEILIHQGNAIVILDNGQFLNFVNIPYITRGITETIPAPILEVVKQKFI